ncbi:MAG: hypothetical protein ACJ76L_08405 [Conexibacter sp.]
MSEPLARLYDLALRTLDDQERRADALRGRLGPVLAAAALGVTLLSGPVLEDPTPTGAIGHLALVVTSGGLFLMLAGMFAILGSRGAVAMELAPRRLELELRRDGVLDDTAAFCSAMIERIDRQWRRNAASLDRLHGHFTLMLCGIHIMLCGLALVSIVG